MINHFKLESIDEVKIFDENLKKYYKANSPFEYNGYLCLEKWFNYCKLDNKNGGRIFTSILDIKLNFIYLDFEMTNATIKWSKEIKTNQSIDILTNFQVFTASFDILQNYSDYVLRYRAIWDKIMGLIILLYCPTKYSIFLKGKNGSRKKMFLKIMQEVNHPLKINISKLLSFIESFDNDFRTPEAHGTGVLRKWILKPSSLAEFNIDNPNTKLNIEYWNGLIYIIAEIDNNFITK